MDRNGERQHRVTLGLVCLVIFVIGNVQAAEEVCRTGCKGAAGKTFKYAVGTTYKYSYNGKIDVSLSSAEGQSTSTEIKAVVLLKQLDNCDQILRLQNVQVIGSNGKKVGAIPDIEKPIRINNNNGILDDSICVVDGDTQNSINVKRAIASIFQASLKSGFETDVFGTCPTESSSHKEGNILVVTKAKHLNKCSYREHIQQDFLATAFNLDSEIKSSPLLNADYIANLRIKDGVLDQATITEDYLYVPFSVGKNGAKAQITSKLQLAGSTADNTPAPVTKPRSIIFENPHPVVAKNINAQTILNAVKEVAQTVDIVVGETTAREFVNLLKIVKKSKKSDLLSVYNQVKSGVGVGDKDSAKRLYLDALLRSGNGESIQALLELLKQNELSETDTKLTLLGLSFVRHATEGSLTAAVQLLDNPNLSREAYLGVGNLVGRYCKQHSCDNVAVVKTLTNKFLAKFGTKPANREQENNVVYALKGLANFHHLNDNILQKLTATAQAKDYPNRVRVAALETYLADPCKDKLRNSALNILKDIQQDSEVRIKAYLVVAQCPTAKIGNAVKTILEKEPSIQVGGFISSHIHSIRASANPDKALAKQHLGFSTKKHFPIDPRKYSFNGEFSYAADTFGSAASSDVNVIYSQNSWLPRSSSLNLTAQVFGHTFNFLEIETRQENLDRLVEHYFGPKGVLRSSAFKDLVGKGKNSYESIAKYVEEKLKGALQRSKRDVTKAEIDQIAKQVQIKTNELNKDLDLDVSLKAFGSEVFFSNFNEKTEKITPEAIIDKIISQLSQGLDKLNGFEKTLRENLLFLDAELNYPTSLGFPLRLAVEGSATVQVKTEGAIDVRRLITSPENGQLRLKLIPSANIEVAGRLTLDALVVENGLKVVSTLYSSTGGDIKLSWDKSTGFDLRYGLPVQEQKIISANHEIVFLTRDQGGREQNLPLKFTQEKDFSICLDQLSPFIGLTFCAEINGPNLGGQQIPILPFPLAGDAKILVTIENNDVSEYRIKHTLQGNPPTHAELTLETIGKNNQRKVALDLQAEYSPEQYVKVQFSSPVKTVLAEARLILTNVEKSLQIRLTNDNDEYTGKIGVSISGSPERTVYRPILQYKTPAGEQPLPITAEGQIVVETNGQNVRYTFENVKLRDMQKEYSINGNFGRENGIVFSDLKLSDGQNSVDLTGRLQISAELLKFNIQVQNTFNSNANFNLKGEFKKQADQYDTAIQLIHGPDLNTKTSILTITSSTVNRYKGVDDFRIGVKRSISYPLYGLSGKFEWEMAPNNFDYELSAEYGELKLGSELEAKINEKTAGDHEIEFEIWGLDNKFEAKSRRQVLPNDESKIANTLELNGKKLEVQGTIKHRIRPQNINIGADLTVNIYSHATPFKVSNGLTITADELDAFYKVSSGSGSVVDAFLKANKNGNANGSIKVNIQNRLTVNGQVRASNGAGNSDILIDLQNGKSQIKGETTFNIQPGKAYDISVVLYPAFNKDKNLKITFSTKTKFSENSLDTQNKADIFGHPVQINIKGSSVGDKEFKYDGEIEATLPGDQYVLLKDSTDYKENNNLLNIQEQGSFEYRKNKNSPGRKIGYKRIWRNSNLEEGIFDVEYSLSADDSNGQNINTDISLKRTNQGGVGQLNLNSKVYGSLLKNPLEIGVSTQYNQGKVGQYEVRGTYGPSNVINIRGSHDSSVETKRSGKFNLQLSTASKDLKTLTVDLSGSATKLDDALQFEGSANVFADDDGTNPEALIDLKSQVNVKIGATNGELKGNVALAKLDPISVVASYNVKENKQGGSGSVSAIYGSKTYKIDSALDRISDVQYKATIGIQTPLEGFKNSQIIVQTKKSKDNKEVNSDVQLSVDGQTWKLNSELVLSDLAPLIDIKLTGPDGKLSEVYVKGNKVSSKQFGGEVKLVNQVQQFNFAGSIFINVEDLENLIIKGQVNSPNLKLNKIVFEAHNKGANNDRKIQILVKSAGKNWISGSTSYSAKEENGKFIIEGSGSFKVKEETKSGNFKYILQKLEEAKDGEIGTEISFDAVLGNQAIDSEFKLTNKHFRFQNSYCEQKKECAYVEIDNKINSNDVNNFNQVLEINLDLRKLGLSHEFGLKAVTTRNDWIIDHTVDAHFQNQENSKYQYSFYFHPQEFGASLTTPKRIIALEAKSIPPKTTEQGGKGSGEIAFYMDKKNHPNKKSALSWSLDINLKGTVTGQAKVAHPGLRRPLVASFNAVREGTPYNGKIRVVSELDVFAVENQKIVATYQKSVALDNEQTKGSAQASLAIQSKGLDIDILVSEVISGDRAKKELNYDGKVNYHVGKSNYENLLSTKWSPNEVSGQVKVLNRVLLKVLHRLQFSEQTQVIQSEISHYNNNPLVSRLEVKNYNTLSYSIGFKNTPKNQLLFNAGFIPGQVADIRSDYSNGGVKTNLFYVTVKLNDAEFLKSSYKIDSIEIPKLLEKVKERSGTYFGGLENLSKEWAENARTEFQNINELTKKAAPNLEPVRKYYVKELEEFRDEILNDKSIKEFGEAVKKVMASSIAAASEIFEKISQTAEQVAQVLQSSFSSVIESVNKQLIPQLSEIASRILAVTKDVLELSLDIALAVLAKASQIIQQYEPELNELTAALGEVGQDVGKIVYVSYENIRENLRAIVNRITTELQTSPIVEELKAQYEQFRKEGIPNADVIVNTVREVFSAIRDSIPQALIVRDDINTLLDLVSNYVEKKLKNQPVDDVAAFEEIGKVVASIVKKAITILSAEGFALPGAKVDYNTLFPLSYLENIPRLTAIRLSPISYLLNQDVSPEVARFLSSLVTTPRNLVPPFPLFGLVIQGQHIFTFDGKHITFPGSCNYLLARDAVNGNFTLAGSYKDGLLTSITLASKTDSITLLQGGKVKLNNANSELPAHKADLAAYRDYEVVTLRSVAGIKVDCTPDLIGCSVSVSGFYHGQVKGLLGNGNNEPYDDFTIPNGKIVNTEGDFGNAYKLTAGCADVAVPKHEQIPENAECNKLFGWDSSLRLCYPFVPTENFKAACAHGLAAKVPRTEESIAKAYVRACNHRNIPVRVPESFAKCTNGDKPYSVGDTFSVKLPSKAADIVLIVDTDKKNKNLYEKLAQTLIPEIGRELKAKGIDDIEIHLITYGGLNQWPTHVTVNGKLTFKGKPPALKFGEAPADKYDLNDIENVRVRQFGEQLKEALHDLGLATGFNLKSQTYATAHSYPFRVNAVKSIIVVNGEACEVGKLYPLQKLFAYLFKNSQISLNLFTPFDTLSLKNSKKAKDVVGFNSQSVFTLSQGKKNPKGSSELHKELNYDDYCVDFTLENRGNAFVNNNFLTLSDADQKQFVNIAASNIIEQLINVEQGLDCECKLVNPYQARNVCEEAYSKTRASKKV